MLDQFLMYTPEMLLEVCVESPVEIFAQEVGWRGLAYMVNKEGMSTNLLYDERSADSRVTPPFARCRSCVSQCIGSCMFSYRRHRADCSCTCPLHSQGSSIFSMVSQVAMRGEYVTAFQNGGRWIQGEIGTPTYVAETSSFIGKDIGATAEGIVVASAGSWLRYLSNAAAKDRVGGRWKDRSSRGVWWRRIEL